MGVSNTALFYCMIITTIVYSNSTVTLYNEDVALSITTSSVGTGLSLTLKGEEKLVAKIGDGKNITATTDCEGADSCLLKGKGYTVTITAIDSGFNISWLTYNMSERFQDCFYLQSERVSWFGGPERYHAEWPINGLKFDEIPYRSSRLENGAVAEWYWLNSRGAYIFVQDRTPLFLDQNTIDVGSMCLIAKQQDPYFRRERVMKKLF